jgi:hypothetical protein
MSTKARLIICVLVVIGIGAIVFRPKTIEKVSVSQSEVVAIEQTAPVQSDVSTTNSYDPTEAKRREQLIALGANPDKSYKLNIQNRNTYRDERTFATKQKQTN